MGSDKEMIKYTCPKCSGKLENPGTMGGRQDTCPLCKFVHPVPLSKSQRKELERRQALEERASLEAAVGRHQQEGRETRSEPQDASTSPSQAISNTPPPLNPPPVGGTGSRKGVAVWVVSGVAVVIAIVLVVVFVVLPGSGKSDGPKPADRAKPADVESLKEFAVLARQIQVGIREGITFKDLDEKDARFRDAYAQMDRRTVPVSLANEVNEAFQQVRGLREAWLKKIRSDDGYEKIAAEEKVQEHMTLAGRALDSFLSEYDRIRSN